MTQNLIRSIGMTLHPKQLNCFDQNSKMGAIAAMLDNLFELFVLNRTVNRQEIWWEVSGLFVNQKYLKSFRSEIQNGHHGRHLEHQLKKIFSLTYKAN